MNICLNSANVVRQQYPLDATRQESDISRENQQDLHTQTPQLAYQAVHEDSMTDGKSWESKARKQHSDEQHRLAPAAQAAVTQIDQQRELP